MEVIYALGVMTFHGVTKYPIFYADAMTEAELYDHFTNRGAILVLEGGEDINPAIYAHRNTYSYFGGYRDKWEIYVYSIAKECNAPILGICRGHQLLAALEGGTLYQDIRTETGISHPSRHTVTYTKEAKELGFFDVMASNPLGINYVNSLHHQGIKDMPPSGIELCRYGDVIEAVWYPRGLGIQWHPELLGHIEVLDYMRAQFLRNEV